MSWELRKYFIITEHLLKEYHVHGHSMHTHEVRPGVAPPYTGKSVKLKFPVAAVIFAGALLFRAVPAVRKDSPMPGRVQQ